MSSICLCVLQLTPLPVFSQDKKDSTQKNTDGTTTTTEKFDWGTKATTLDSKGMLIDTVTTEGNDKFGKGGTKTKIESHKNGKHIDIVVYKDKSEKIRRAEKTEFLVGGTYTRTVNYDETGRLTSYIYRDLKKIISGTEVGQDASGQPKVVAAYGEKERETLKHINMEDIDPGPVLKEGDILLAEIREATERPRIATGQSGRIDPCLVGTWRSETGKLAHDDNTGGSGILLTIKTDGTATIDYDGMKEIKDTLQGRLIQSNSWSGNATGRISTKEGQVAVDSVENSALSGKQTDQYGTQTLKSDGLGVVFRGRGKPPSPWILNYTCDDISLTIKSSAFGLTTGTFVFKREK